MTSFPTSIITSRRVVPNFFPIDDSGPYKIAIIGEAPGEEEEQHGQPFIGKSGQLLNSLLRDADIDRNKCFVGNVCQVRPPGNEISRFEWSGSEIQDGISQLSNDLSIFQPNISILLGNIPLRVAKDPSAKVSSWSSSLFLGNAGSAFAGRKCISGFHPAGILRFWGMDGNFARLKACIVRARNDGECKELILPSRELITHLSASALCHLMDNWPAGQRCSVDIEGGLPNGCVNDGVRADSKRRRYIGWRCVALSARPSKAFAIAWWKFTELEHALLLRSFAGLMARIDVPKVLQNSLYESFVLGYGYGIPVLNVVEDTMLKMHEKYCELPKSLSVGASIYTREPHWKDEEMYETTGESLAIGCCRDTAVTVEICESLDSCLDGPAKQHYQTNIAMLNPALYMELRGIRYDQEAVSKKKAEVREALDRCGERVNEITGKESRGKKGSLSSTRLAKVLYTELDYEPQFKKENGRKTTKFTTDVEAILHLQKKLPSDNLLRHILEHRHLEGLLETLSISPDADGRVRCSYNVVGTETGRFSCKTSPTGSGANLTTITKSLRSNYTADPSYDLFQCDLSGADGWTVAAHCARLGDPTMLDDYLAGLKPAKIIAALYGFGETVNRLDRDSLAFWGSKRPFAAISQELGEWVYQGCKKVAHGSNYKMGIPTMQTNLMKDSFKETGVPVYLDFHTTQDLQNHYFRRYQGVPLWHAWATSTLVSKGTLTTPSGHTRVFFGKRFGRDIHDTVKEFLAHEPQSTTTWSTNLAMLNLWRDPENRVAMVDRVRFLVHTCSGAVHYWSGPISALDRLVPGSLLIEPLHQVHDALIGQWPKFLRDWASPKVKSYFNNPILIAGREIIIPFDGGYGDNWGECKNPI